MRFTGTDTRNGQRSTVATAAVSSRTFGCPSLLWAGNRNNCLEPLIVLGCALATIDMAGSGSGEKKGSLLCMNFFQLFQPNACPPIRECKYSLYHKSVSGYRPFSLASLPDYTRVYFHHTTDDTMTPPSANRRGDCTKLESN